MATTSIPPPARPLKILINSMDGAGHANSCVGLGQALLKRGHTVIFLMPDTMAGNFTKYGFGEILLTKPSTETSTTTTEEAPNPIKAFAELLLRTGIVSDKPPIEKLQDFIAQEDCLLNTICGNLTAFDGQMEEAIKRERPDFLILAQFLVPPAFVRSGVPWFALVPFNPIGLYVHPKVPPFFSGFPIASDPASWEAFRQFQQIEYLGAFRKYQAKLNAACGYAPPETPVDPNKSYFLMSKWLNVYATPKELDYTDTAPTPETAFQIDAFCREETGAPLELPVDFAKPGEKLIYFSLGSMGAVDVALVKRILAVLAKTPYKYIVSKGPLADQYELPNSTHFWGGGYLPQTRVLPLVDLVITHGGNNTVTETFTFGKAMIVLPLFSDQYDNAQRIDEKGYGIRINPYNFAEGQLLQAIERLLNEPKIHQRMAAAAKRIKEEKRKERVCQQMEEIVEKLSGKIV